MKIKSSTSASLLALVVCVLFLMLQSVDLPINTDVGIYLVSIVLQIVIFAVPTLIYCRIRKNGIVRRLRIKPFAPRKLLLLVTAAAIMILSNMLINFLRVKFGGSVEQFSLYRNFIAIPTDEFGKIAAATFAFALLPAVCEEFLFRSVLLSEYQTKGPFTAIAMSTLLFAIVHFSPEKLPEYIISGMILAFLTYVTDSALAAVLAHFLYNFFCLFGLGYINRIITHLQSTDLLIFVCAVLLLLLLALALSQAQRIYKALSEQNKKPEYLSLIEGDEKPLMRFFSTLTSPPMLACLLLFFAVAYQLT